MIRPPPSTTLFPNTTLFLSLSGKASCDASATPKRPFVSLSWSVSAGATSYDVVRDNDVIQTTTSTAAGDAEIRSEEHTSELHPPDPLLCPLLLPNNTSPNTH